MKECSDSFVFRPLGCYFFWPLPVWHTQAPNGVNPDCDILEYLLFESSKLLSKYVRLKRYSYVGINSMESATVSAQL